MHYNEWIKKYSPKNKIYTAADVARMMGISKELYRYHVVVRGVGMKDQKKPRLEESGK